jgi:hypothetical protein
VLKNGQAQQGSIPSREEVFGASASSDLDPKEVGKEKDGYEHEPKRLSPSRHIV